MNKYQRLIDKISWRTNKNMNKSIKKLKAGVNNVVYIGPKRAPKFHGEMELNYGVRGVSIYNDEWPNNLIDFRPQGLNIEHIVDMKYLWLEDEITQGVNEYLQ
jgi:hypothetical protein